jgi:kynurenine 3-monooxygenase
VKHPPHLLARKLIAHRESGYTVSMSDAANSHIMIVGAGLAGALMACYLGNAGYRVSVYERRPDPRIKGFIGGRSINLALSTRGITALEEVGVAQTVLAQGIPMRGRMMHDTTGDLAFQAYSANPEDAIHSVDRGQLNIALLDAADNYEHVSFYFDHRCLNLDPPEASASFEHVPHSEFVEASADLIIGTDGAFSAVRSRLQREDRFNYSQEYLEHGYKELVIPPASEIPGFSGKDHDGFAMDPHALHIWPRGGYMMIALPNQDRTFTCTCFWPFRGSTGFEAIKSEDDIEPFFQKHFPDAIPLMPTLRETYMANPTSSLVTVRCFPWHYKNKVVLLGDAAHAIVPFFGQGMNAAFEDCRILHDLIKQYGAQWDIVLEMFTMKRKVHADAIADMALANFIEMRDSVASPLFRLRKKMDNTLHRLMPNTFMPLYNMVSFSNIPYAQAKARAEGQNRLLAVAAIAVIAIIALLLIVGVAALL